MRKLFLSRLRCLIIGVLLSTQVHAQVVDIRELDFTKADSVAAFYSGHSLDDIKLLSDHLTESLPTEVEKFRAIYKWVCDNIENDYRNFQMCTIKREKLKDKPDEFAEWNRTFSRSVIQKLQQDYKTVCTGYAALIRELSYHAGLRCEIVNGYGRTAQSNVGGPGVVNHSWNAIQFNGQWHLCDPTWSSGTIFPDKGGFIPNFNDEYFLPDPKWFALNHYPIDTSRLLMQDKPILHDFLNGPLTYKSALARQVYPGHPETFESEIKKGETISFRFEAKKPIDVEKVKLKFVQGGDTNFEDAMTRKDCDGFYTMEYKFDRRGSYVVHIMLGDDYLISYSVRVLK